MPRRLVPKHTAAGLSGTSAFNADWHETVSTVRRTGAGKPAFGTIHTLGKAAIQFEGVGAGALVDDRVIEDEIIDEADITGAGVDCTLQSLIAQRSTLARKQLATFNPVSEDTETPISKQSAARP